MKSIIKRFKSKTYWLAILIALSSQLPLAQDLLAEFYGPIMIIISVAIAALREVTTKPVSEK